MTKDTCVKSSGFVSFLRVFRHSFFPRLVDVVIRGNAMPSRQSQRATTSTQSSIVPRVAILTRLLM